MLVSTQKNLENGSTKKPTNKPMKRLSIYLFLILFTLPTPSQADDISDFEIEGMSIGDSLLDYYSEAKIKEARVKTGFKSNKFYRVVFLNSKIYDALMFYLKTDDNNYKIYSINAALNYPNKINECNNKKVLIANELSTLFENSKKHSYTKNHPQDETGESIFHSVDFYFENGGGSRVMCIDWSEKMEFIDHLRITISSEEFRNFVNNEAYK